MPSPAEIESELAALAASAPFRGAARHLRFLRHLVELSVAGDAAGQREMALGVAVFLRPAGRFDPRRDTIVRVEARRLRQKLAAYYQGEGRMARLEFVLPVGSYALQIRPREALAEGPLAQALSRLSLGRTALALGTLQGGIRAVELADEALALVPGLGSALLLRADALIWAVGLTALPSPGALPAALEAASAALHDPGLSVAEQASAHGLLATLAFSYERQWPLALARVQRALSLEPSARLHARHGWMLMFAGRLDAARTAYAQARRLDPLSLHFRCHEALVDLYARDYERARAVFDEVLSVSPGFVIAQSLQAALHLYAGRLEAGRLSYQALIEQLPGLSIGRCGLAQALALAGDTPAARRECQCLIALADAGQAPPYQVAMVQARLGDAGAALLWLRRAAEQHDFNFVCAGVDPAFDALRRQPDVAAFLVAQGITTTIRP